MFPQFGWAYGAQLGHSFDDSAVMLGIELASWNQHPLVRQVRSKTMRQALLHSLLQTGHVAVIRSMHCTKQLEMQSAWFI